MYTFFDLPNDILELIYKKKHQMEWREVLKSAGDKRHLSRFSEHLVPGKNYKIYREVVCNPSRDCYYKIMADGEWYKYLRTTKNHHIFMEPYGRKSKFSRTAKNPICFENMTNRKIYMEICNEKHLQKVANGVRG